MIVLLRTVIALLAVAGLFEVIWRLCCLLSRKTGKCRKIRILLQPEERSDPDLLVKCLLLILDRLGAGRDAEVLLIRPRAGDDDFSRLTEARYSRARRVSRKEAMKALDGFWDEV